MTLVTDSGAYVLVIDDMIKYDSIMKSYFRYDEESYQLDKDYTRAGLDGKLSIAEKGKNFLKFLKDKKAGLTIFKSNADFTDFKQMGLIHADKDLTLTPCP